MGSGVGPRAMGALVDGIRASLLQTAALTITSMAAVLVDATTVAAVALTPPNDSVSDSLS